MVLFPYAGAPSINLNSSMDVISGGDVCPNVTVNFTCDATEVAFLRWLRNGVVIEAYNSADPIGMIVVPPYNVSLDAVRRFPSTALANFTSRLVVNLSDLMSGDNISCSQDPLQKSNIISYTVRGNKGSMYMCMCIMLVYFCGKKKSMCVVILTNNSL